MQLYLAAFGYLPRVIELETRGDTSLTVMLPVDSVAIRMIGQQIARLEERRKGRAVSASPPLTRDQLVRFSDPGLYTLLQRQGLLDRVACVMVDEVHWE